MTIRCKAIFAITIAACAATAAIAQQHPSTTTRPAAAASSLPADHYNVVTEKNIFVRERRKPVVLTSRPTSTRPAPSLEASLVLRGVVLEESAFRAYFENTIANELIRVGAGDALAKGHVVEISIDAVAFEGPSGVVWVRIGDNLVGSRVASVETPAPSGASSASPPASGNLSSIEERMRQRRGQRESGRQ